MREGLSPCPGTWGGGVLAGWWRVCNPSARPGGKKKGGGAGKATRRRGGGGGGLERGKGKDRKRRGTEGEGDGGRGEGQRGGVGAIREDSRRDSNAYSEGPWAITL